MQFGTRTNFSSSGSNRLGTGVLSVAVAVALFAGVVGVALWVADRNDTAEITADAKATEAKVRATQEDQSAASPEKDRARTPELAKSPATSRQTVELAESDPAGAIAEPVVATPAVDPAEARRDRLTAQLAAGEFGPALETAQSAEDAGERTELLKSVAEAQMEQNEFDGALAAIRRIPLVEERVQTESEHASRQSLAGGGPDYQALEDLIKSVVQGPTILWEDVDGEGGTIDRFENGVRVDPNGVLQQITRQEQDNRLKSLGVTARVADLNEDMAQPSPMRLVSLTRLEAEIAKRIADGQPVVSTMMHLAGLYKVEYVFVYPDAGEVVIGGPAQAWRYNENGTPVGVESGRPTLQLDDLVTVLRTFSEDGSAFFSCTIDPRKEGLASLNEYLVRTNKAGSLKPSFVRYWTRQLQERLGLQDVRITGVPADSRVSRVIVEADYRMKLVGIGKLDAGPDIPSYFDLLPLTGETKSQAMNALRWWLTMKYDALTHSPDRNVFALRGSAVLCQSEDVLIDGQGQQVHTGKASTANRLFAERFTQHYDQLAAADPIFADLQNVFDLSLVAALFRHEGFAGQTGWDLGVFAAGGAYQPATYEPPTTAESAVNHRVYGGRDIVVQVAGGVNGNLMSIVRNDQIVQETPRLAGFAEQHKASELPEGRWWWDAAR